MTVPQTPVDPLARFEAEHQVALEELDALERIVVALETGEPLERHAMRAQVILSFLEGDVEPPRRPSRTSTAN